MYNFKYLNGVLVEIVRTFTVGDTWYHDVVEVATRKKHRVELHELTDYFDNHTIKNMSEEQSETVNEIAPDIVFVCQKNNKKTLLVKDGKEYVKFVNKHKLDDFAIENCLNHKQKTHKGFQIYWLGEK